MRTPALALPALLALLAACGDGGPPPLVPGSARFAERRAPVGRFHVEWVGSGWQDASLRIGHESRPGAPLWQSLPGRGFVSAARGEERVEETRGSFSVRDRILERCAGQSVEVFEIGRRRVRLAGRLACPGRDVDWELALEAVGTQQLRMQLRVRGEGIDRTRLLFASDPQERIFGFGEQFTHFDLKGRRVPILVREQGIGRGRQPLTWLVDRIAGSGGDWHTSYAPVPHFMTTRLRSFFLENAEYSVFDLRQPDAIRVEVWSDALTARLLVADSPLALIREYTRYAGRMRPLPDWVHRGAIVGLQGGTARVREALRKLEAAGTPLAAFWLQDWVGRRDTEFGQQLWWSWQLDRQRYPDWEALLEELSQRGIRVMTYANPFLVDARGHGAGRDLLAEARDAGFLVQRPEGGPYWTPITFEAVLVDLTKPAARDWLVGVLRDELIGVGASGWMADFGEALPWDAVLSGGEPASRWHNRYPELWAELNRRALREAGLEEDGVFFARSGFTRSPRHATLFWLGDQLVSWDEHDGIKSAVTGLLSGGLSGFAFNHSDIGGYTTLVTPVYALRRSRELLMRWIELGAFQVVFRTHEGNRPAENHQFDSDEETLRHFSRFARVHEAWGFYRDALIAEAARTGAPVLRHPWLHDPDEPWTRTVRYEQFRVGSEILVAPVLDPGVAERDVRLPPGRWVHLWSDRAYGDDARSTRVRVPAPIGSPPVFYREGSRVGARFRANLERAGVLDRFATGS